MGSSESHQKLARLPERDILPSIRSSVGGLPASAARQTPPYDARLTTKTWWTPAVNIGPSTGDQYVSTARGSRPPNAFALIAGC
jgi:hypothetical protein